MYEALAEAYQVQGDAHQSERWLRKSIAAAAAGGGGGAIQETSSPSAASPGALLTYARFLAKNVSLNLLISFTVFPTPFPPGGLFWPLLASSSHF